MTNKILILGSGSNHEIDHDAFDSIYAANASITRLKDTSCTQLIISDAMLFDKVDLDKHKPIDGMTREESTKFRQKKYDSINNINSFKITVLDSGEGINIKKRLIKKNLKAQSINIISTGQLWSLFIFSFHFLDLIKIFFNLPNILKLKFLGQFLLKKRMSTQFRPSLGLISIMLAIKENPNASIFFDGINVIDNNNNRHAFYKGLKTLTYKKTSHLFDQLYIKILIESKQIKLNAK
jgi:hypothetical protein